MTTEDERRRSSLGDTEPQPLDHLQLLRDDGGEQGGGTGQGVWEGSFTVRSDMFLPVETPFFCVLSKERQHSYWRRGRPLSFCSEPRPHPLFYKLGPAAPLRLFHAFSLPSLPNKGTRRRMKPG